MYYLYRPPPCLPLLFLFTSCLDNYAALCKYGGRRKPGCVDPISASPSFGLLSVRRIRESKADYAVPHACLPCATNQEFESNDLIEKPSSYSSSGDHANLRIWYVLKSNQASACECVSHPSGWWFFIPQNGQKETNQTLQQMYKNPSWEGYRNRLINE